MSPVPATQLSKNQNFTGDNTNTALNWVFTYSATQSRFYVTWSGNYTLSINNSVLGYTASGMTTPAYAQSIPKFFFNYLCLATNLNCYNQVVGNSKVAALAKIVIDQPYNAFIFYKNYYGYMTCISNREIFNLEVILNDEFGQEANMNGANWSATVQIDFKKIIPTDLGAGTM